MSMVWNKNIRYWQLSVHMTLLTVPLWFASFTMPLGKDMAYPVFVNTVK
jgi:hypothetical protein